MDCFQDNANFKYVRLIQGLLGIAMDYFLMILGPCLICTVATIVAGELYCFFEFLIPVYYEAWTLPWFIHSCFAVFLAVNVSFNYGMCVSTNPGTHDSEVYKRLLSEADADSNKFSGRQPSSGASSGAGGGAAVANRRTTRDSAIPSTSWIDQGEYEWGYCRRTKVRKAPRAHYDGITKKLVLNMDHYCPWMFNVVGYMNYRYFVNFLLYVMIACIYGLFLTASPFIGFVRRHQELSPGRTFGLGHGYTRRSAVCYTFILAFSISIAVGLLLAWHIYLIGSAQTTIEFYGNSTKAHRAKLRGLKYQNPYDLGSFCNNWKQVYGPMPVLLGLLPSRRQPPFPPWPQRSLQHERHEDLQSEHIV